MSSGTNHSTNSHIIFPASSTNNPPQQSEGNILQPVGNIPRPVTSSNSPACAVCKYRRRRCATDCQLAPYFPADRQKDFLNAHKLFGVSNMLRVLDRINDPVKKEIAMKTMIYQANVRSIDPVLGCCRMIDQLQRTILRCKEELDHTLYLLKLYQSQSLHEMQDYTSYNMQDHYVGNGKAIIDAESNNGIREREYMDINDMTDLSHKTRKNIQDLGDGFEQINIENGDDASKFKGLQNILRGQLVQGYVNNEPSALDAHITSKKLDLTTTAPLFPM